MKALVYSLMQKKGAPLEHLFTIYIQNYFFNSFTVFLVFPLTHCTK
jgi:hypothetical protein